MRTRLTSGSRETSHWSSLRPLSSSDTVIVWIDGESGTEGIVRKRSALSNRHSAKPVYRKGRKERKEMEVDFKSSVIRLATARAQRRALAVFAPFAVQSLWLGAEC